MNLMSLMRSALASKTKLPDQQKALPGRSQTLFKQELHCIKQVPITPPFAEQMQQAVFGLGCFWGAEKQFWSLPGVYTTAVGYAGGLTPHPTYEEVCSGMTSHNEVVQVVFDPAIVTYDRLLTVFFEAHNPTQGMRQGADVGTQYRSGIYTLNETQGAQAQQALAQYQQVLSDAGHAKITTEIETLLNFYYAEGYHQQYLFKNPQGYCGLGGTGVCMPPASD